MSTSELFGKLRVVHNVAKGPAVDVFVDGKQVLSNVGYSKVSEYLKVPSGNHSIEVTPYKSISRLAGVQASVAPGADYTVIAGGDINRPESLGLLVLQNDKTCPQRGQSHVRFVHAAATVPAVDVWVDGPTMLFRDVSYGSSGVPAYVPVQAKTYHVGVSPAGSKDLVAKPQEVSLKDGQIYTLVASGLLNDKDAPIKALMIKDSSDGMCYVGDTMTKI